MIGWFYGLLSITSHNAPYSSEAKGSDQACEILQVQKAYAAQFKLSGKTEKTTYSYKNLSLWLQCIQRVGERGEHNNQSRSSMLRSPTTLSHAAKTLINRLVLDTLVCTENVTQDFFQHFAGGNGEGGCGLMVQFLVQWIEQLDVLRGWWSVK